MVAFAIALSKRPRLLSWRALQLVKTRRFHRHKILRNTGTLIPYVIRGSPWTRIRSLCVAGEFTGSLSVFLHRDQLHHRRISHRHPPENLPPRIPDNSSSLGRVQQPHGRISHGHFVSLLRPRPRSGHSDETRPGFVGAI